MGLTDMCQIIRDSDTGSLSEEKRFTQGSLLRERCSGLMGVPITFLDKYCPEQFEIIALGNSLENFTPSKVYRNPKKHKKTGDVVSGEAINHVLTYMLKKEPADEVYYTADNCNGFLFAPYARILIKHTVKED